MILRGADLRHVGHLSGPALTERMTTDTVIPPLTGEEETMAKAKAKKAKGKVPFGGYAVCFKGCTDTLEGLFGADPMPPSGMTKKLWDYVKRHKLASRG